MVGLAGQPTWLTQNFYLVGYLWGQPLIFSKMEATIRFVHKLIAGVGDEIFQLTSFQEKANPVPWLRVVGEMSSRNIPKANLPGGMHMNIL